MLEASEAENTKPCADYRGGPAQRLPARCIPCNHSGLPARCIPYTHCLSAAPQRPTVCQLPRGAPPPHLPVEEVVTRRPRAAGCGRVLLQVLRAGWRVQGWRSDSCCWHVRAGSRRAAGARSPQGRPHPAHGRSRNVRPPLAPCIPLEQAHSSHQQPWPPWPLSQPCRAPIRHAGAAPCLTGPPTCGPRPLHGHSQPQQRSPPHDLARAVPAEAGAPQSAP